MSEWKIPIENFPVLIAEIIVEKFQLHYKKSEGVILYLYLKEVNSIPKRYLH
jgi:hypothetical protein